MSRFFEPVIATTQCGASLVFLVIIQDFNFFEFDKRSQACNEITKISGTVQIPDPEKATRMIKVDD